jgi:polyvinyl alcohol dehydrogenase (cytochrome)
LYRQLCASCHDGANERAPGRDVLRTMTPERVLASLQGGPMMAMASNRTPAEHRAIAEFVTGQTFARGATTTPAPETMCPSTAGAFDALGGPRWNTWGANNANTRFQDGPMAGLTEAQVPALELKWAFGFPGEVNADSQPTIAGGRVFVGSQSGLVYALSAATGCIHWYFQATAAVRAAVTLARIDTGSGPRDLALIDDRAANVYAVDAGTGTLV